ncbi:MAG: hypothetical protein CSB33_04760 [Desulfobacterales bacterium]|nr:MAG: hypothetical protein CSB33_04760 [Desulfobacterales bacterium]
MTGIDRPRTDAADTLAFIYYPNAASQGLNRGMLHRIVNGLNHTTTFSQYNGFGKPERAEDANNVITTYAYDARGRMISRTTSGVTTGYTYDNAGRLVKITLPGNRGITYTYTDANLLEKITDNAGNSISYSCDEAENRIREELKDASETLAAYMDFIYDAFNRLNKIIYPGTGSPYEEYGYDGNDNPVSFRDGNGKVTGYAYDVLQRVEILIRPGDILSTVKI